MARQSAAQVTARISLYLFAFVAVGIVAVFLLVVVAVLAS